MEDIRTKIIDALPIKIKKHGDSIFNDAIELVDLLQTDRFKEASIETVADVMVEVAQILKALGFTKSESDEFSIVFVLNLSNDRVVEMPSHIN